MDIVEYVNRIGFTNLCYDSGDGNVTCYSNLEGMWATVDKTAREIEFSAIDGLIKSSVTMGYPNANIPHVLKVLQRHVFQQ